MTLTIYTGTLCPYSKRLKEDLAKLQIPYIEKISDQNMDDAVAMYKLTQGDKTPVIHIQKDGEEYILIGYSKANKEKILSLVK